MSYREHRPHQRWIAFLNRVVALLAALGFSPCDAVALEVPGRRTGRLRRTALVFAEYQGSRYFVSLPGEAEWVRNVRAHHYPVFRNIDIETVKIVLSRPIEGTAHPN